jgi:hypothetical protein
LETAGVRFALKLVPLTLVTGIVSGVFCAPTTSASGLRSQPGSTDLKTLHRGRLVLAYPLSWRAHAMQVNTMAGDVLALLGTTDATAGCIPPDATPAVCGVFYRLTPGTVEMSIQYPRLPHPPGTYLNAPPKEGTFLSIDGVPGLITEAAPRAGPTADADVAITLVVAEPGTSREYVITGVAKGPNALQARAQIIHALRSIHWDPPFVPLSATAATKARIAALTLRHLGPDYACFPKVPGQSATSLTTRFPGQSARRTPLSVTCTTNITAMPIGLWRLDLVARWTKSSTHDAGVAIAQVWIAPSGTVLVTGGEHGIPWT